LAETYIMHSAAPYTALVEFAGDAGTITIEAQTPATGVAFHNHVTITAGTIVTSAVPFNIGAAASLHLEANAATALNLTGAVTHTWASSTAVMIDEGADVVISNTGNLTLSMDVALQGSTVFTVAGTLTTGANSAIDFN